jgi:RHS repeat-associated protein
MRAVPSFLRLVASFLFALVLASCARGQITNVTNQTSTPIPGAGHDYIKMLSETVNPANGSVSIRIQTPTPPGRRMSLPFAFAYDSSGAQHVTSTGVGGLFWADNVAYLAKGGWSYSIPMLSYMQVKEKTPGYGGPATRCTFYTNYVFQDATGGRHSLYLSPVPSPQPSCDYAVPIVPVATLSGGDDYYQAVMGTNDLAPILADTDGTVYAFGCPHNAPNNGSSRSSLSSSIEDRNGNLVTISDLACISGTAGAFTATDTVGRTLLSSSGFGTSGNTLSVAGLPTPYTLTWGTATTNFSVGSSLVFNSSNGCASFPHDSTSLNVISKITLPNNTSYNISYDSTYGLVSKITYPTGGFVRYTWGVNPLSEFADYEDLTGIPNSCGYHYDAVAVAHRYVSFDGVSTALQQDFTYSTVWSSNGSAWTSKTTTVKTTDLVTSAVSTMVYTYSPITPPDQPNVETFFAQLLPVEQSIVTKNSAGTTLRTVNKTWLDQYLLNTQQTVLENGLTSQTNYFYACGPQSSGQADYDFGSGAPGGLLRKTVTTCQTFNPTPIYPNAASIFDRPCQSIVYDSSGTNRVAETDYFYDGSTSTTPCSSPTTQTLTGTGSYTGHDETHYGTSASVSRGNLTKVVKLCLQAAPNCGGGNPTTTSIYDETGQITSTTDPNGKITQFSYADSYTILSGGVNISYTPTGNTNAFLTTITDPLTHTQNFTYDFNNGQLTVSKDQNSLTTTYLYNDPFARPTLTTRPDNGQTTAAYNDTALTVTTSKKINTSQTVTTVALSDGVGHIKQTQITSDPQGTIYTDTTYDGLGRVYTVSNPYRSGSDPTTSSGTTTFFYDALGRKCLEVSPDGTQPTGGVCPTTQPANDLFTTYSGNTTTVTDQTGKSRKSVTDALGRLTYVFEDPAGLNYETDYTYDALGNLLTVNQKGGTANSSLWRARTFTYDSLSRLLTSNNPEVGTIAYKYDLDANCTSPNSFIGLLISKTDARGIRTCAQYDAINREVALNYSNGDPTVTTAYDQAACLGLSTCQNIGHRTSMTDAAGSEAWSYQVDASNNRSAHVERRTTSSITKTSTYYLDQAGNVTQAVYPTGRVVNYTYDNADRPSTAADGSNGITYATDFQTAPTGCLTGKVCYTPQGTFYALSIGQASTFTGLNLTHSYNSRLQPLEFKASSTGGNAIDITYGFVDPATNHNAGHVYSITNNMDTTRSQNFTYDSLNRITSALTTSTHATSPSHCWGETYNPDAWGNLQSIAATTNSNYTGCSQESGFTATADGNNHLNIFSYDSSGNTQSDGVNSYTWDGESQLKTAAGVTYAYDGDGRRVSKSSGKLYWYGSGGDILAETDASGNTTAEYIFFGGKRIAMLPASSTPIYYVEDMLGTSRVITTNTGTACYDADFYPYGGERPYNNTCPQNYKFEGKERDTETGNDDFGARYYSNRFGRWLSADWSSVPVAIPYANLTNPQTLNLYAMVADDPETFADLDGHCDANDWCGTLAGIAGGLNNAVNHAYDGIVATLKDPLTPVSAAVQFADNGLKAYETKGVSGVLSDLAAQGREGATEIVTEAVLTGGLAAAANAPEATGVQANRTSGLAFEEKALASEGLQKNTTPMEAVDPKTGKTGTTIPDAQRANGQTVEAKNVKTLSDSRQLRRQSVISAKSGQKAQVLVNKNNIQKVSPTVQNRMNVKKIDP